MRKSLTAYFVLLIVALVSPQAYGVQIVLDPCITDLTEVSKTGTAKILGQMGFTADLGGALYVNGPVGVSVGAAGKLSFYLNNIALDRFTLIPVTSTLRDNSSTFAAPAVHLISGGMYRKQSLRSARSSTERGGVGQFGDDQLKNLLSLSSRGIGEQLCAIGFQGPTSARVYSYLIEGDRPSALATTEQGVITRLFIQYDPLEALQGTVFQFHNAMFQLENAVFRGLGSTPDGVPTIKIENSLATAVIELGRHTATISRK